MSERRRGIITAPTAAPPGRNTGLRIGHSHDTTGVDPNVRPPRQNQAIIDQQGRPVSRQPRPVVDADGNPFKRGLASATLETLQTTAQRTETCTRCGSTFPSSAIKTLQRSVEGAGDIKVCETCAGEVTRDDWKLQGDDVLIDPDGRPYDAGSDDPANHVEKSTFYRPESAAPPMTGTTGAIRDPAAGRFGRAYTPKS